MRFAHTPPDTCEKSGIKVCSLVPKEKKRKTKRKEKWPYDEALTMKPYPHLYVKPVFRPDFYNCIMSHIPPSAITERVYNRLPNDRYQLTIQGKYFGPGKKRNPKIPVKSRHFWNDFAVAFGGDEMVRLWLEKFDITLRHRQFSYRDAPKAFYYSFDIGRDKRGYEIGPHTARVCWSPSPTHPTNVRLYTPRVYTECVPGTL